MSYRLEFAILTDEAAAARARYEQCDDEECGRTPLWDDAYFELAAPYRLHVAIVVMAWALSEMHQLAVVHEATATTVSAQAESAPAV